MKTIQLTQGRVATVDDEDFTTLSQYSWCYQKSKTSKTGYAAARVDGKVVRMHRFLMGFPKDLEVDHRDQNGLNNQRENLRLATSSNNKMNISRRADNTSGHKGVFYRKDTGRYQAFIRKNGKRTTLGCFDTAEEAAIAYECAARRLHGEFARTS